MSRNTQLNTPSEQTKACIYAYTAQTRSPDVKTQIEACRAIAEASGLTILKTEIDGGRGPRDGLARVLRNAGEGVFDTVVIDLENAGFEMTDHRPMVAKRVHAYVAPGDSVDGSCTEAAAVAELEVEVREQGGVISSITSDWGIPIGGGRDGLSLSLIHI